MTGSDVIHSFGTLPIAQITATRSPIEMEFGSKCSILHGQVVYIEK